MNVIFVDILNKEWRSNFLNNGNRYATEVAVSSQIGQLFFYYKYIQNKQNKSSQFYNLITPVPLITNTCVTFDDTLTVLENVGLPFLIILNPLNSL